MSKTHHPPPEQVTYQVFLTKDARKNPEKVKIAEGSIQELLDKQNRKYMKELDGGSKTPFGWAGLILDEAGIEKIKNNELIAEISEDYKLELNTTPDWVVQRGADPALVMDCQYP